jgi:hypothetical protein
LYGLYCALYSLYNFDNYKSAIDWVISLDKKHKTTNTSITGSLIGAYFGYDLLVNSCDVDYIKTIPNFCNFYDLDDLCQKLYRLQ